MKRYITKYTEDGKLYAEAWDQINIFGKAYTFHRRRIEIPVKHGRWIEHGKDDNRCSLCGWGVWVNTNNYCPHCGAKMDEEE